MGAGSCRLSCLLSGRCDMQALGATTARCCQHRHQLRQRPASRQPLSMAPRRPAGGARAAVVVRAGFLDAILAGVKGGASSLSGVAEDKSEEFGSFGTSVRYIFLRAGPNVAEDVPLPTPARIRSSRYASRG